MTETDFLGIIANGEGIQVEFKENWDIRPERLAREIVSFANTQGGKIFIGVSDAGDLVGIEEDKQAWLMDAVIGRYVHPFIFAEYNLVKMQDKQIAVINVPRGAAKPYVVKKKNREDPYIRVGNTCQLATREQQQRLFEAGGLLSVEKLPVHGTSVDMLDERRVEEYFCKKLELAGDWESDRQDLLLLHEFLVKQEDLSSPCSYFACALFAKMPTRHLPQSGIRLTAFPGKDKDYDMKMDETLDMPFIGLEEKSSTGYSEPSLVDQAIKLLMPHISRDVLNVEESAQRRRHWDYPEEAIRELIVNAFAHRDWTRANVIEVAVYSDRLEVQSPGALPNGMTVEKIKAGARAPRNNQIISIFRSYGFMEDLGMGIRHKVIPLMEKNNNQSPIFEATEDYFRVVLPKKES